MMSETIRPTRAEFNHTRARVARSTRTHGADAPETINARRDFAAAKIADHIAKVVADAPPLTAEQRDRLTAILRGGSVA